MNFFELGEDEGFTTIIGNPPYVRYQDISPGTRRLIGESVLDKRAQTSPVFHRKVPAPARPRWRTHFHHPARFPQGNLGRAAQCLAFEAGTITDFIDLGDLHLFDDATPNCAIWRFVRGDESRETRYATLGQKAGVAGLTDLNWEKRRFLEVADTCCFRCKTTRSALPTSLSSRWARSPALTNSMPAWHTAAAISSAHQPPATAKHGA